MKAKDGAVLVLPALALAMWLISRGCVPRNPEESGKTPREPAGEEVGREVGIAAQISPTEDVPLRTSSVPGKMKPGGTPPWVSDQIDILAECFEAQSEQSDRLEILRDFARRSIVGGNPAVGLEIVTSMSALIDEEKLLAEVEKLIRSLKRETIAQGSMTSAAMAQRSEKTRVLGRLEHMKGELLRAKSHKSSPQDIRSIETVISGLKTELSNLEPK